MNIKKSAMSLVLATGLVISNTAFASAKTLTNFKIYFNENCKWAESFKEFCKPEIQLPETENNQKPETQTPSPEQNGSVQVPADEFELKVLELVNVERAKHGLSALTWDSSLAKVAEAHSLDMANNNFFSHTNLKGQSPFDRIKAFGISYSYAAENIAAGQKTPESVMNSWMNSEGHRKNILNANLKRLGVGYVKGGSYGTYWTQVFAG